MALLDDVKLALRISSNAFNFEISDLIEAARADLRLSGVLDLKIDDDDPLIKRAIIVYAKANFGFDNSDSDKLMQSYNSIKQHLTLSAEYTGVVSS